MRILSFFLTFTFAVTCEALSQLTVSFSIWSPISMDLALVDAMVSVTLRSFLCHEAGITLLGTDYRSVCFERTTIENNVFSNVAQLSMLDFMRQSDPIRSYLSDEVSNVLVSDFYQTDSIQGTTWHITYDVLQVGSMDVEKARMANFTDEVAFIEYRIQEGLNLSIAEGMMNERFRGTEISMGKVGQAFVALPPESSLAFGEENIDADPELNYEQSSEILRYIGILMLAGSFCSIIILTFMGRRYARERERKETAVVDPEYQKGLVTEQGVNLMLERGRRESERMSTNERNV